MNKYMKKTIVVNSHFYEEGDIITIGPDRMKVVKASFGTLILRDLNILEKLWLFLKSV